MPPHGPKSHFLGGGHNAAASAHRLQANRGGRIPSGPRNGLHHAQHQQQQQQQAAPVVVATPQGSSLIVSSLPTDVSQKDVVDLFVVTVGALTACRLVHNEKGEFEGIALVDFVDADSAALAYDLYNGKMIDKQTPLQISLVFSEPPSSSYPSAPAPAPPAPVASTSSLSNLAPFPAQARKLHQQQQQRQLPVAPPPSGPRANGQHNQPKPKQQQQQQAKPAASLIGRMGPPVVSLGERLGPVVGGGGVEAVVGAGGGGGKKGGKKQIRKKGSGPRKSGAGTGGGSGNGEGDAIVID